LIERAKESAAKLDPTSAEDFRQVLGHFPTGVVLITADDDEPVGVAVGSFVSVSLDPPLVGFFVGRGSTTWPRIQSAGAFAANLMREQHGPVCREFAIQGADRFASVAWRPGIHGAPLLDEALATVECDIERVVEAGDHLLVLGAVRELDLRGGEEPLVFFQGSFKALDRAAG
jgi:3-hydroxy-9,10-secoandrosta-1,3,5(10)-triene-9,17-dione monooxygenase reductase component